MKKSLIKHTIFTKKILTGAILLLLSSGIVKADLKNDQVISPNEVVNITQQQKKTITGIITDEYGEAVIGASIAQKGTTIGTITDLDGKFTLEVPEGATLQISYIGYINQSIVVGTSNTYDIILKEDTQTLDEVVVVAYGSQKKVNLTGSVSAIKMSEMIESRPITNLSTGLSGMAAGVQINSASNRPGDDNSSIKIRGQGTLNNAAPLVIIDGVEGDISSVNPQDVENVSVLKDAASAAIYGSRAANGVVLITTKKGKEGKIKLDYNGYVSFESIGKVVETVSNYADYMELMNEGYLNSNPNNKPYFSQEKIDLWRANEGKDPIKYPNTNWVDEVFSTSVATNHVLSMSGASDKISFYTSFGYLNNPGVMENSGYTRYNLRANLEAKIKPWLTIGTNLSGYQANLEIGTEKIQRAFDYAGVSSPGMVLRHPDGRYGAVNNSEDDPQANNPLFDLNNLDGDITIRNIKPRFYATIAPFKGFSVTGSYTYEFQDKEKWERPIFLDRWNFLTETIVSVGQGQSYITNYNQKMKHSFMDAVARYENSLVNNKLQYSIMVGASQEEHVRHYFQAKKMDLIDPGLGVIEGATGNMSNEGRYDQDWAMRSYFGRINLSWEDKYLMEANLRADGSSRFQPDNRWGYFPSVSGAWRMEQEAFMEGTRSWLDNLKVRASYGSLGNSDLGKYEFVESTKLWTMGDYSSVPVFSQTNYILNNALQMGLSQTAIANSLLTWETTYITDIGVDVTVLKNRLSGTFDYFNKRSKDILIELPAPGVHGDATIPRKNSAEVVNQGIEITLGWQDKIGDFSYYVNGNITYIKNEVTKFKGDEYEIKDNGIIKEGLPIQAQYLRKVDRIIRNEADLAYVQSLIDNAPIDPNTGKQKNPFATTKRPELGDILYADLNKDGVINDDDRTPIGNGANPKFAYGLTLGASWKGLDFSMLIQGITGVEMYWLDTYYRPTTRFGNSINKQLAEGRWTPENTNAKYPRLLDYADTRNTLPSDMWLQDKSYLKIRNIQLGYTLPKTLTEKVQLDKLRIYGSLENFFTFTSYDGMDPEVSGTNYPTMKQAVIGVNLTF